MKKTDIVLIVIIVIISLAASYFIGQAVLGQFKQADTQVEVTDPITSTITPPDEKIFNKDAINPAVPINIGDSLNREPFGE